MQHRPGGRQMQHRPGGRQMQHRPGGRLVRRDPRSRLEPLLPASPRHALRRPAASAAPTSAAAGRRCRYSTGPICHRAIAWPAPPWCSTTTPPWWSARDGRGGWRRAGRWCWSVRTRPHPDPLPQGERGPEAGLWPAWWGKPHPTPDGASARLAQLFAPPMVRIQHPVVDLEHLVRRRVVVELLEHRRASLAAQALPALGIVYQLAQAPGQRRR